jgi:phenylacetate-CoA ligase
VKHAALAYWLARDARAASGALDLAPEALHALASRRLRALLVHAQHSPFNDARLRAAGIARPASLRDIELELALQSIAPVTKRDVREAGDDAFQNGRASAAWFSSQSSGSSGEPFRVFYDPRAWSMLKYLVKMRSRRAAGVALSDRVAILDAIPIAAEGHALLERSGRVRRISVFRAPAEIATLLADYRPAAIYALPSALLEVARAMHEGAPHVRVPRIFTSGELLGHRARDTIAGAFGCALFDVYGTSETKEIAWECASGSRHLNADVVHVEILDERGAVAPRGIEGEIVVTSLMNVAMPLIRYRTGDRGTFLDSSCDCGRRTPLLGIVSGREADTLELPDGTTRSPYMFTMALEPISDLAQYQIVQEERDLLHVSAVISAGARTDGATIARAIRDSLREILPRDIRIEVALVATLERGPREKVRVVQPLARTRDVNRVSNALSGASK